MSKVQWEGDVDSFMEVLCRRKCRQCGERTKDNEVLQVTSDEDIEDPEKAGNTAIFSLLETE